MGCGISNPLVLSVNHLDNARGARSAKRTGVRLYKDVLQSNDPQKHFDLRCLNCQLLYEYQTGKVSLPTSEEFSVLQAHLKDSSTT